MIKTASFFKLNFHELILNILTSIRAKLSSRAKKLNNFEQTLLYLSKVLIFYDLENRGRFYILYAVMYLLRLFLYTERIEEILSNDSTIENFLLT